MRFLFVLLNQADVIGGYMDSFILKKYKEFYEKNGYIPKMFNPYHAKEITDVAPTITTYCGSTTSSATVLIVVGDEEWK